MSNSTFFTSDSVSLFYSTLPVCEIIEISNRRVIPTLWQPQMQSLFLWPLPKIIQYQSVQSLSRVQLLAAPWISARQASLSITNSRSLLKLMSIKLVMPSSHLILCRPLLLLPPIPPRIRVFSNESTLRMRWPKYWSFNFSISPDYST